jgi:hypothetical protein
VVVARIAWVTALVAAGCGRVGFDAGADGATGGTDASGDARADAGDAAMVTCPAAYTVVIGNSRYRVGNAGADDWLVGEADCEAEGTHVAIPNSQAELDALAAVAGIEVWIGITDRVAPEVWREVTGGLATFLPWRSGKPSGVAGEDCVYWDVAAGEYRNQDCTSGRTWVCECDGAAADPAAY